jgi:hypothetical protein
MGDLYLHAVLIRKPCSLPLARKKAQEWIKNSYRRFYRESDDWFYFRNIPSKNFKELKLLESEDAILAVGELKDSSPRLDGTG